MRDDETKNVSADDYEYSYTGHLSLAGMMDGYLLETADEDAGEFKYFYMMPDTPATTYHLEFRYGSSKEDLNKLCGTMQMYRAAFGMEGF